MVNDSSLPLLYERIQRWRLKRNPERVAESRLKEKIESLEREVAWLRKAIDGWLEEKQKR